MATDEWMYAWASATGNSHLAEAIPCQDYGSVRLFKKFAIAIVCDGAGSCTHSHVGAEQVAGFAFSRFQELIELNEWSLPENLPDESTWNWAAKQVLGEVKNDLQHFSELSGLPFASLSCTIIATIVLNKALLITHIGDGRAGYSDITGQWQAMLSPFRGNEVNETVFITSDIWDEQLVDRFLESRVISGDIQAFCLMTDGCEKAAFECNLYDAEKEIYHDPNLPYKDFFHTNVTVHMPALQRQKKSQAEINSLWQQFLEVGNERLAIEPDDKTMILAVKIPPTFT